MLTPTRPVARPKTEYLGVVVRGASGGHLPRDTRVAALSWPIENRAGRWEPTTDPLEVTEMLDPQSGELVCIVRKCFVRVR